MNGMFKNEWMFKNELDDFTKFDLYINIVSILHMFCANILFFFKLMWEDSKKGAYQTNNNNINNNNIFSENIYKPVVLRVYCMMALQNIFDLCGTLILYSIEI